MCTRCCLACGSLLMYKKSHSSVHLKQFLNNDLTDRQLGPNTNTFGSRQLDAWTRCLSVTLECCWSFFFFFDRIIFDLHLLNIFIWECVFLSIYSLLIHPKLLITPHCWRSGKLVSPCVCSMCSARASGELQFKILTDHPGTFLGLGHAFCRNMKNTFQRNACSVTRDRRRSFCSWSGRNGDLTLVIVRRSAALF